MKFVLKELGLCFDLIIIEKESSKFDLQNKVKIKVRNFWIRPNTNTMRSLILNLSTTRMLILKMHWTKLPKLRRREFKCIAPILYILILFLKIVPIFITVSAQIRGRRLIKILGFYGGGLLQFLPQKASKRGLLAQKSGGLLEFQSSGGLIKSGLLFARIR